MMTSTENIPTPTREPSSLSSLRSNSDQDTPIERYSCDSTPPVGSTRQTRFPSQSTHTAPLSSSSSSPYVLRNPSPPPIENLSRADMVGDEMYSKSWFCRVLLKLIHFVAPEQVNDEIFAKIRQEDQDFLVEHADKKQELNERFESELCELWDISMSADVAHLLIEFQALDLFHVVLIECKDKRCTEIVLGILSNLACCKRNLMINDEELSIAQCILQHSNLFSAILSILTSDDYSDCPTLVQLYRLIYTLFVRQDTRSSMLEHLLLTYEPICFILQSCCNKDLLEQCSQLLRILFDECHLFEQNDQNEAAYLFLTSITTALTTIFENLTSDYDLLLENLFNCLQIYTTYEHCVEMLNEHCQVVMNLVEVALDRLVHDDIVPIRSVPLLSCISLTNFYLNRNGLKVMNKSLLEYFLIIGQTSYKDRHRREHQTRRQRSRTHSHSSNKRQSTNNDDQQENSSSHNEWDETGEVQSNPETELNRSISEDLSTVSYNLIDDLLLELFFQGIKHEGHQANAESHIFRQLTEDQRELFRKLIKHFCNIEKRLDDLLDL